MRNIWIICQKELHSYFSSPIAYLLLTIYAFIFGYFFWNMLGYFVMMGMESQMRGQSFPMNVNEQVIRPLLSNISVIGLFLIPIITMRLFAEEKRTGTIELLATSPIRDYEIIVGKWLAALLMYCSMLAFTAIDVIFIFRYGNPDWKPVAIGYLGLILQGGGLLALGTFISTTTKNQIIAAALTFAVCLILWVLDWSVGFETAQWAQVLAYFSITRHFESFSKGLLDMKDAVYYVSTIIFGLFLTGRAMESLRWRS
jgi:ABC-2 type transport system permease protein